MKNNQFHIVGRIPKPWEKPVRVIPGYSRPKGETVTVVKYCRNEPCPCGSGTKYKKCHGK